MTFTSIIAFPLTILYLSLIGCTTGACLGQESVPVPLNKTAAHPAIHWYNPLAGGTLELLVILPATNTREIELLTKRLDANATVLATEARYKWHSDPASTQLALTNTYDCILIGKVAWDVIPRTERELIIKHVERGAGLVYVSPHLHDATITETNPLRMQLNQLFRGPDQLGLYRTVHARSAYAFNQLVYYRDRLVTSDLPALPRNLYRQSPFYLSSLAMAKGRVIAMDYDDTGISNDNIPALMPYIDDDHLDVHTRQITPTRQDLWMLGLAMGILHSCNRYSNSQVSFLTKSVVPTPLIDRNFVTPRHLREIYARRYYRYRLDDAEYYVVPPRADDSLKSFHYRIRSSFNQVITADKIEIGEQDKIVFKIPMLEQGHYLVDGFYLDKQGRVINCGNTSFEVVSVSKIRECKVSLDQLRDTGSATCEFILAQELSESQDVKIMITDITGKELHTISFTTDAFTRRFNFALTPENTPNQPFLLHCMLVDNDGVIVRHIELVNLTDAK